MFFALKNDLFAAFESKSQREQFCRVAGYKPINNPHAEAQGRANLFGIPFVWGRV